MRRSASIAMLAIVVSVIGVPAAWAAGMAPPPALGPNQKISAPTVTAIIVLDPHPVGSTPTAGMGSLWVRKGSLTAGQTFNSSVPFMLGCDLSLTDTRFPPGRALQDFIPFTTLQEVFAGLGIIVTPTPFSTSPPSNIPVISDVSSAVCTPNFLGGKLSLELTIQFLTPR